MNTLSDRALRGYLDGELSIKSWLRASGIEPTPSAIEMVKEALFAEADRREVARQDEDRALAAASTW